MGENQIHLDEKRSFWKQHQLKWAESGLSQRAYCQRESLKLSTFSLWRSRLNHPEEKKEASSQGRLRLMPLGSGFQGPKAPTAIVLQFSDCRLTVNQGTPPDLLEMVVKALRSS